MLLVFIIIVVLVQRQEGAVIRHEFEENFSPYFAAFSKIDRSQIAEYERLKRSLMYFKAIDWNVVVQPKITESEDSSS